MGTVGNTIMPTKRKWAQHGQSGLWVSDWYPNIAQHVDDLAVIRSCWADGLNHVGSVCQMNTGAIIAGRPSLGAWLTYGLGRGQREPAGVRDPDRQQERGRRRAELEFGISARHLQGHAVAARRSADPAPRTARRRSATTQQRGLLDLLVDMNRHHAQGRPAESELDARHRILRTGISHANLRRRKRWTSPRVGRSRSSMYGLDDPATEAFGKNCLMARRLVERGVRFVELYCGSGSGWDAHADMEGNHSKWCKASDKPIAGLLAGSEGPRLAEGHARRVGRRVRPHTFQ